MKKYLSTDNIALKFEIRKGNQWTIIMDNNTVM